MKLPVPGMVACLVVARPVDDAAEADEEVSPGRLSFLAAVIGMRVDPVLKGVDGRDPGEDEYDTLEQLPVGPVGVVGTVERIQPARAQKLHGHRRDLAKLERAFAVGC